jgi:hypothetical protein
MAKALPGAEIEAPLPMDRVTPLRPFAVTGIDYAGPLFVKVGGTLKKSYIALFTCATTRAVHLELCLDMSTDKFLLALQRFTGRRGLPNIVYINNAQTFHATNRELRELGTVLSAAKTPQYFAENGIRWKFIAPRAAWWGGWWERMIATTKRCLRKVLGRSQVDAEGLQTILVGIEASLNSRPITQDDENETLTPAHFLTGGRLTAIPQGPEPVLTQSLTRAFQQNQRLTETLWRCWQKEYLLQLRSHHEVRRPSRLGPKWKVGDIVLLQEEKLPRLMWKRARIDELIPGRDGQIRTVKLCLPDRTKISRPVQLVIPLEIDQGGENVEG